MTVAIKVYSDENSGINYCVKEILSHLKINYSLQSLKSFANILDCDSVNIVVTL